MVPRFAAPLLLFLLCASAFPQTSPETPAQPDPNIPRAFHDPALDVTYFYPGRFVLAKPVQSGLAKAEAARKCVQPTLSGSSVTPIGTSFFILSSIDSTCPNVLQGAAQKLDAFTREQVLLHLKLYGNPVITHDATRYLIDGHPAAITIASVQLAAPADVNNIAPPRFTFAAKACVLRNIPDRHSKSSPADETKNILCFDFTTHERDLLPLMLAFTMQFDGRTPQPIVPGNILR